MRPVNTAVAVREGMDGSGRGKLLKLMPGPGEEILEPSCGMIGQAGEDVGEPGLRVDAVELGGFDERVHGGRTFATAIGAGEGPVVAADGDAAQRPLGSVVGEADPAISQEAVERGPALEGVVDRLADLGLARRAITLGAQPGLELVDDPRRLLRRASRRASALWPLISRSMANSRSIRVTASAAIGAFDTWASS